MPCTRIFLGGLQGDLLRQERLPSNVPSPSAGDLWREGAARNSLCKLDLRDATGSVRTGVPSADPVCDVKKRKTWPTRPFRSGPDSETAIALASLYRILQCEAFNIPSSTASAPLLDELLRIDDAA